MSEMQSYQFSGFLDCLDCYEGSGPFRFLVVGNKRDIIVEGRSCPHCGANTKILPQRQRRNRVQRLIKNVSGSYETKWVESETGA